MLDNDILQEAGPAREWFDAEIVRDGLTEIRKRGSRTQVGSGANTRSRD